MKQQYDLIVIGAGPGGYVAAIKAAQAGMSVAVVEAREAGGTCLNRGCIPTKSLLHVSHLYREMRQCEALGIRIENLSFDRKIIHNRKTEVVKRLRDGVENLLKANKVDLIAGRAKIMGSGHVHVLVEGGESQALKANNIMIAAGSVPAVPSIPGVELPGVLTSDELLERDETFCESIAIIGGGVIGVEFATVFSDFGCAVTIIEAEDRILPLMDREISQNLGMILKRRGVTVCSASGVEEIRQGERGLICAFQQKGKPQNLEVETVLVATGRKANLEGLLGKGVVLEYNRGIVVNSSFQTSLPGVYAIGDVVEGSIQLAHAASAQGCAAVAHIVGNTADADLAAVPSCIYTNPEIACVGMTADMAKAQGLAVKIGKYSMAGNGKSILESQERGFIKLIFDAETEVLLGAQLMCARATDLISELAGAIDNKLTAQSLARVIRPHPTFAEGITEAVEDIWEKAVHVMPKRH